MSLERGTTTRLSIKQLSKKFSELIKNKCLSIVNNAPLPPPRVNLLTLETHPCTFLRHVAVSKTVPVVAGSKSQGSRTRQ